MVKCIYCGNKKAKRRCPGLNGDICSFCCGQYRGKAINCTNNCSFINSNQTYYIQKNREDFLKQRAYLYKNAHKKDKKVGLDFIGFIDFLLYKHFYNKPDTKDFEALSLLDSLRRRLSPIELVVQYESLQVRAIFEEMDKFLNDTMLDSTNALDIIDSFISNANEFVGGNTDSNIYIRQLFSLLETENPALCRYVKEGYADKGQVIIPHAHLYTGEESNHGEEGEEGRHGEEGEARRIIIP